MSNLYRQYSWILENRTNGGINSDCCCNLWSASLFKLEDYYWHICMSPTIDNNDDHYLQEREWEQYKYDMIRFNSILVVHYCKLNKKKKKTNKVHYYMLIISPILPFSKSSPNFFRNFKTVSKNNMIPMITKAKLFKICMKLTYLIWYRWLAYLPFTQDTQVTQGNRACVWITVIQGTE